MWQNDILWLIWLVSKSLRRAAQNSIAGNPQGFQTNYERESVKLVLGLPQGLHPVRHAWCCFSGSQLVGILVRYLNYISWLLLIQSSSGSSQRLSWIADHPITERCLATLWRNLFLLPAVANYLIHLLTLQLIFFHNSWIRSQILKLLHQEWWSFFSREPWPKTWRCWVSTLPLHVKQWNIWLLVGSLLWILSREQNYLQITGIFLLSPHTGCNAKKVNMHLPAFRHKIAWSGDPDTPHSCSTSCNRCRDTLW